MTHPAAPRADGRPPPAVTVISFGYGHKDKDGRPVPPPPAHLTLDVRTHFRDPHVDPALRYMTAGDAPVVEAVLRTRGVERLIRSVTEAVQAILEGPSAAPLTVAFGCAGGRHRSAVIANETVRHLRHLGIAVTAVHRDMHRPVIERTCTTGKEEDR